MENILSIEPGSVLWTIITFLVVVWLIAKYGWKPIIKSLNDREKSIHDDLETAKVEREKASALLRDYEASIARAKKEAADIILDAQNKSNLIRDEEMEKTRDMVMKMNERARAEIARDTDAAKAEIKEFVADLTVRATSKLLGATIDVKQHEKLIQDALKEQS